MAAVAAQAITGTGDVNVLRVRLAPTSDAQSGFIPGSVNYVIATVELTNNTDDDYVPDIAKFFLTTPQKARYSGQDSGDPVIIGIRNSYATLAYGQKRTFTVAFRTTEPNISGTISYEP
jgi:hypothetical protein